MVRVKLFFRRPAKRKMALKAAMLSLPAIGLAVASWFGMQALRRD